MATIEQPQGAGTRCTHVTININGQNVRVEVVNCSGQGKASIKELKNKSTNTRFEDGRDQDATQPTLQDTDPNCTPPLPTPPQRGFIQTPIPLTPDGSSASGSSTELESVIEMDPDCPDAIPQTQPGWRRGIFYIPRGMRKVYRKKLRFDDDQLVRSPLNENTK